MPKLIGKAPNQVPTNADLGSMAFQDREGINVNNAIVANLVVTGATSVNTPFAIVNSSANVVYVTATGSVGIGTATPSQRFEVVGGNARFVTSGQGDLTLSHSGLVTSITAASSVQLALGAGGSERVRVSATGNVGIGNTAPAHRLSVNGSVRFDTNVLSIDSATSNTAAAIHLFTANTASGAYIRHIHPGGNVAFDTGYDTSASRYYINRFNTSGSYVDTPMTVDRATGNISFVSQQLQVQGITQVSNSSAVVLYAGANGNVGIGNSTPNAKLLVGGNVWIKPNETGANALALSLGRFSDGNSSAYDFITDDATSDSLTIRSNRFNGYFYWTRGSSVGTVNVATMEAVNGARTDFNIFHTETDNTAKVRLSTGVDSYINSTANVGIGTSVPDAKFHVVGTANVSGNVRFGQDLTVVGNLTVTGTTTYINTTNLDIGDNIITLNADVTGATAPTEDAGININRGSAANATFIWDETNDNWSIRVGAVSKLNVSNTAVTVTGNTSLSLGTTNGGLEGGELSFAGVSGDPSRIIDIDGSNNWRFNTYSSNGSITFNTQNSPVSRLHIAANGNIGIGNTTPADTLVIENNAANNIVRIRSTNSAVLFIESDSDNVDETNHPQIIFSQDGGVVRGRVGYSGGGNGLAVINEFADVLALGSNNIPTMYIVANNNIGIGNSTPAHALRIESGVLSLGNTTSNVQITIPTSVQASATNFWLNANGQWSQITGIAATGQGTNGAIQYNDSGATQGSAALSFNNTTNTVNLTGNLTITATTGVAPAITFTANTGGASQIIKPSSNTTVSQRLDIGNVGSNNALNPFWSGVHLNPPDGSFTNSTSGAHFPRVSLFYSYTSNNNPSDLYFNIRTGNETGIGQGIRIYSSNTTAGQSGVDIAANGNVGINNAAPADRLSVNGSIRFTNSSASVFLAAANGNIGIGNTTPTDKVSIEGNLRANNLRRYTANRTLSTTVNDTVEIGTLYSESGAHSLDVTIQVSDGSFSVTKRYVINSPWNATASTTYRKVLPFFDSGPFSSNDYDLEAYHNNQTIGLRVRRIGGATSGTLEIMIDDLVLQSEGTTLDYFTPSSTAASGVAAVTDVFPGSRIINNGIGSSNAFVVQANLTTAAITSNNTVTAFNLPVTFNGTVSVGNFTSASLGLVTSATTANQVLFTAAAASWRTTKYLVQITSGSAYQATEIVLIHDGTNVYKSEYGQVFSGAVLATFDADINSGNVRLLTTPVNAVTTYKGSVSLIPV